MCSFQIVELTHDQLLMEMIIEGFFNSLKGSEGFVTAAGVCFGVVSGATSHKSFKTVEKLQFAFSMISSLQRSQTFLALFVAFLKIACLHVSFTAHENFYKLTKNTLSSQLLSTFSPSELSEFRNPTIKHISTYTLVHSSIRGLPYERSNLMFKCHSNLGFLLFPSKNLIPLLQN